MRDRDFDDRRKSAGELMGELERMLPDRVVGKHVSPRSKLPFKVVMLAGALAWRTHQMARAALAAYDDQMHVAGILSTRAVMETMAALNTLHHLVTTYGGGDVDGLDERLMAGIFGSRNRDDRPKARNILSDIDRVAKRSPALRSLYDELSEYAHPNDSGTVTAFVRIDPNGQAALFTAMGEDPGRRAWTLIESLATTLALAVALYEDLREGLPAFSIRCEQDVAT